MPSTVIYANLLPFIAIFILMFFLRINPMFDKHQNKMFFISAVILLFMLTIISIDYTVSLMTLKYGWVIRRITSFISFSFSCSLPIFLILIFTNKKMSYALYIPAIINIILCAASMFTNWVFFMPQEGGYERGPLFLVPSIVTVFYIICLLTYTIKHSYNRSYEALFIFGVILGFILSLYLEIIERFKFLSWDFAVVSLILYYLLLNINKSKFDPLTKANNRAMYIQKIDSLNKSHSCFIAMIDINGFKIINDKKGHSEGDKLLIQFTKTATAFMNNKNVLYRIGGDEFAIISEEESLCKFKNIIDDFLNELKAYDIYCAVGIESYTAEEDIENTIREADLKMYEDKRKFYLHTSLNSDENK